MRAFGGEALILDVFDLHETDRIVTLLTRERGKTKGVARGARRKYSRFAGQLQPLARVRVRWFEKEGRELVRIGDVELVRPAHRLQQDLEGILLGSYLAEHLTEIVQENEPSELYFRLLDSTVEALLEGVDRDLAARYFEAWALRLAGIFPAPRECPLCGRPFPERGGVLPPGDEAVVCADCAASGSGMGAAGAAGGGRPGIVGASLGLPVDSEVLGLLVRLGREPLAELARRPPAARVLRRTERLNAEVRRRFLGKELRSYDVIQSLRPVLDPASGGTKGPAAPTR
jgi:DNA repair protein RecO (recombination protein O)